MKKSLAQFENCIPSGFLTKIVTINLQERNQVLHHSVNSVNVVHVCSVCRNYKSSWNSLKFRRNTSRMSRKI